MNFVSEQHIDQVIDQLESMNEIQYEQRMQAFSEAQPVIFAWLFSEQFDLLTDDEKGFLHYLALIAWSAIVKVNGPQAPVSEDELGEAEEINIEVLENSSAKSFRDRLNPFFEGSEQEDLLAFAEDAVLEYDSDPEFVLTKDGREPIFVALKTIIDVLT